MHTYIEKFEAIYTNLEEFLICRLADNVDRRHISVPLCKNDFSLTNIWTLVGESPIFASLDTYAICN